MSRIGNALRLFRASADAVPAGALRPSDTFWVDPGGGGSMTMWWNPGWGPRPPVSWVPGTGEFETHWDWALTEALSVPAYWRGRMLISQSVGGMPLQAWRNLQRVEPNPLVLREPSPGEDRCTTVAAWVGDLIDHGNAIGYVTGVDAEGKATSLRPWPAVSTAAWRTERGALEYGFYEQGQLGFVLPASQVFHAKGVLPWPGALRGMGVLEAGLSTLDRMQSETAYAAKAFANGTPSGLLRVKDPDLQVGSDDDEPGYATAKGIKKAWQQQVRNGEIAVLSELVDFTPLSWTPTDAQMVEARQLSLVDVANLLNLDPYWVGSSQVSQPYQNVGQAGLNLSRFTLDGWTNPIEAQFSRLLPRGQEARFNRDTILRDDQSTRVDNYVKLLGAGAVTVDEVRAIEGLPPLPDAAPPANVSPLFPATGDTATNQPATGTGG